MIIYEKILRRLLHEELNDIDVKVILDDGEDGRYDYTVPSFQVQDALNNEDSFEQFLSDVEGDITDVAGWKVAGWDSGDDDLENAYNNLLSDEEGTGAA